MSLRISALKSAYEESVLKGLSLEVKEGEMLGIMGSSGSGKTTLLKCISGHQPFGGEISIDGQRLASSDQMLVPGRAEVALVDQDFNLRAFVELGTQLKGSKRWQNKLLRTFQIRNLKERKSHTLSGGQQQRFALSRALAKQSDILLLDEAFAHVDQQMKGQFLDFIREEIRPKYSVLVTHEPQDILRYCDQLLILKDGRKHQLGTVQELFQYPKSAYAAGLLGAFTEVDDDLRQKLKEVGIVLPDPLKFLRPLHWQEVKSGGVQAEIVQTRFNGICYEHLC